MLTYILLYLFLSIFGPLYYLFFLIGPWAIYEQFDDETIRHQHHRVDIGGVLFLFLFVAFSFYELFKYSNYYYFKIKDKRIITILDGVKIIFYSILFVFMLNFNSASNIKSGHAVYDIQFKYKNETIKTDTNLVYVGATQNYIFLRKRRTRENYIYKSDQIENLSMTKIAYENDQLAWIKRLFDWQTMGLVPL